MKAKLPDYACTVNDNNRALEKVGLSNIKVFMKDFSGERVLTHQNIFIALGTEQGAHMSRLVEKVYSLDGEQIVCDDDFLVSIADTHDSISSRWECRWQTKFNGEKEFMMDVFLEGVFLNEECKWYLTFTVPYASVCPCSHEMVKAAGHGVPHMQRSIAQITGEINEFDDLDNLLIVAASRVADTVDLVPEGLMKRPDELAWCERAADINLFVEDSSRAIADVIDDIFPDWTVVVRHMESIHEHDVIAVARKGDRLI